MNNNFELSKKDGCEETNLNDDEDTLEDSNTQNVKYDAKDTNHIEDDDKDDVFVEGVNEKENPDWDSLEKKYGDTKVDLMLDLDTLYKEYVLNEQQ